ncbi:phosphotransferase [Croceicoccus sp. F390]|uniref:Phosphotransferase n=1 Tax=Croceicoccus esteveae TaxID=3075597 RepID=A0ABU2ZI47_9SPHN|nr:phosphotransferase [Croceicoccus sp. F390]MDT0575886.1 phosphotransferase [Croceicoccus sp. F390]
MDDAAAPHRLDIVRLRNWLHAFVPDAAGAIELEKFAGGQSNPTYAIRVDGAVRFVLRKKPPGTLLPSAHAVEREFRITHVLAGTSVPVARPLALCEDASVIGTPFFVMEHVAGRNFWDPALPGLTRGERGGIYREMIRVLAALHMLDPAALGLSDFGRQGDYIARQVSRWSRQHRACETQHIAEMEHLVAWLQANNPGRMHSCIVHGDYRNDNIIFASDAPSIEAVIDWELATLGDPLADLAQHVLAWRLPHEDYRGLADVDRASLGIPDEAAYIQQYWHAMDMREPPPAVWSFALAFAAFRNAAIRQGVFRRALDGNASSDVAAVHGVRARQIATLGWRIASGEHDAVLAP